jgi:hypothetical protein
MFCTAFSVHSNGLYIAKYFYYDRFMKTILAAICVFTILATGYLSVSLLILQPPRANYSQWFLSAAVFVTQSGLTLIALCAARRKVLPYAAMIGGAGIVWFGISAVTRVNGPHFEGYALVLGAGLILQGALTLAVVGSRLIKTA